MALQFSDVSANKNGLIQECEALCFGDYAYGRISGDATLLSTFTRNLNEATNIVASWIMQSDNRWQWDDNNQTDYPIATTSLVTTVGSEQQDYTFPVTYLKILRAEVMDKAGNWCRLEPIDQADIYDQSVTDFMKSAGLPKYYDKMANSIFLYPKPADSAVTASGGLKVWFQRPPTYFTTSDTTKVPGFNSLYHKLVALIASKIYAEGNEMSNASTLANSVEVMHQELTDFYALRNKDEHIKLSAKKYNFR